MIRLIIICSEKQDSSIFSYIKKFLKNSKLHCFFINKQSAERHIGGKGYDSIILMQTDNINKLKNTRADIIIFDQGFKIKNYEKSNFNDSIAAAIVYDNFDSSLTPFINDNKYTVISCGINPKNTVTISSITDDSISIFIQREFSSLDLEKIEQQEFCVFVKELTNKYSVMAAFVSAVLLGFTKEFFEKNNILN